jgi:flavin-dependent dehydrogenase
MTGEVTIIGAGPAGSATAILLARRGWSVTLVEQHRFPRDKVCGECLSAIGLESLARMGLLEPLQTHKPIILTHAAIHTRGGKSIGLRLPRPMWGISRRTFDQFLLEAAREAGATIVQPARCEAVEPGSPITVRIRMLGSTQTQTLHSRHVIIADGKAALLGTPPPRTNDFGIKAHFENVVGPRDTIELFGCDGLYGGLVAIESDRWNAAFSVPAHRLRECRGNVAALFAQIMAENPVLERRLTNARRIGDWLAAPLPRFAVQNHWPTRIVPVGNAAAALEPIGGEGMGLALQSAELAAESLTNSTDTPSISSLASGYRRLWRIRRPSCRTAALVVSRPGVAQTLLPLVDRFPSIAGLLLNLIGK